MGMGFREIDQAAGKPVPVDLLKMLAEERERQVNADVEQIAETHASLKYDALKLGELIQYGREDVHQDPLAPIRSLLALIGDLPDKTSDRRSGNNDRNFSAPPEGDYEVLPGDNLSHYLINQVPVRFETDNPPC
jgi:hypothetical protein